jgi:TonB family protein
MFDYAISSSKRRRLSGRTISSYIVSGFIHLLMILALVEYPQLLRGGFYHRFNSLSRIADHLMSKSKDGSDRWRTVVVLKPQSKMMAPSAATLKKYMYDWSKKGKGDEAPPIRIRFGDEQKAALKDLPPMPRIRQEPKLPELSLPPNELAAANTSALSGDSSSKSLPNAGYEPAFPRREPGALPAPIYPPKNESAENSAPSSIPKGIKPPTSTDAAPPGAVRVFESEQKAIHSPDSGIFDTKGFPLGEYVNIIKERIKGNWFIPSNLQNFQGHTTIIFYIERDGRYANARIVKKSGSNSFDNAALMAVIGSDPFPPLPEGFPGKHIGAKFVLSWNEQ